MNATNQSGASALEDSDLKHQLDSLENELRMGTIKKVASQWIRHRFFISESQK